MFAAAVTRAGRSDFMVSVMLSRRAENRPPCAGSSTVARASCHSCVCRPRLAARELHRARRDAVEPEGQGPLDPSELCGDLYGASAKQAYYAASRAAFLGQKPRALVAEAAGTSSLFDVSVLAPQGSNRLGQLALFSALRDSNAVACDGIACRARTAIHEATDFVCECRRLAETLSELGFGGLVYRVGSAH